jgi:hypothetical protein
MSNWLDCEVEVLESDPHEINQIAERLKRPSSELVNWIAEQFGRSLSEDIEGLRKLVQFEAVQNLGYVHPSVNKARRFRLSFKDRFTGIVRSHLGEVSQAFPEAIFLIEYRDMQYSYSGKEVIRAGEIVQSIHDGAQKAQAVDWVLLDIFAPFVPNMKQNCDLAAYGENGWMT